LVELEQQALVVPIPELQALAEPELQALAEPELQA